MIALSGLFYHPQTKMSYLYFDRLAYLDLFLDHLIVCSVETFVPSGKIPPGLSEDPSASPHMIVLSGVEVGGA